MSQLELTAKSFSEWVKAWNIGHKRLWLTLSLVWFLAFMIPNAWQYVSNISYCNKLEERSTFSPGTEGYKRCNVNQSREDYVNYKGENSSYDAYEITSAKYNPLPIFWAIIPPLLIPMIIYIAAWVRSGYKNENT
jgi:hypothetical protein